MSRFLLGDELGNIKALRYSPDSSQEQKTSLKNVYRSEGSTRVVQRLSTSSPSSETTVRLSSFELHVWYHKRSLPQPFQMDFALSLR